MEQLSKIDRNILTTLQADGRISYADLARKVGLTTTPFTERVKRLERDGYIKGYSAQLNPDQLGAGLIVFVQIRLVRTSKAGFDEFKKAVIKLLEVQECYLVSGTFDYLIKARVANIAAYREFLGDTLLTLPSVQESTSIAVMEAVKETLAISLPRS